MIKTPFHKQMCPSKQAGQIVYLGDYVKQVMEKEMTKTVYIEHSSGEYRELFKLLGFKVIDNLEAADLVVFTGGADVSPKLYGDVQHPTTYNDPFRDHKEALVFRFCVEHSIPMVGICRGGQFLNVMSGGRMYQHVDKHTAPHFITDLETGEVVYVSSTHHQMMLPSDKAQLVASSNLGGFREWYDGEVFKRDISSQDIEVVYYEHTNALCFQPHPEFNDVGYESMKQYFKSLLSRFLGV